MSIKKSHAIILRGRSARWLTSMGTAFRDGLRKIAGSGIFVGLGGKNFTNPRGMEIHGLDGLEGEDLKEIRDVIKAFNEAEQSHVSPEASSSWLFGRRILESQTKIIEAQSRLAQVRAVKAEIELVQKLKRLGIELKVDQNGVLTILPSPSQSQHAESSESLKPGRRSPKL